MTSTLNVSKNCRKLGIQKERIYCSQSTSVNLNIGTIYSYALNNPLKYVDPDGRYEYQTELLGKRITVKISDKLKPETQEMVRKNIDEAIAKINAAKDKLTENQIRIVNGINKLEVNQQGHTIGMNGSTFQMVPSTTGIIGNKNRSDGLSVDFTAAAIIHDAFHKEQDRRGQDTLTRDAERAASAFAFRRV